ncbi:MAG: guanylate kinase [Oscillospiraceae bacterium]|nr:guanylate kinase [Oscillospiraceae bacterium]
MAGLLLVVSGPSGAGKSTVLNAVMAKRKDMFFSVSATTRAPRPGETDGVQYSFVSPDEFHRMLQEGRLLETGSFAGNWYGTPLDPVMERLGSGETVVLDIESAGAAQVKEKYPNAVLIFLTPSTEEEAERRLRNRGTENEEKVLKRMADSRREYMQIDQYRYIVVNDTVEVAVQAMEAIIIAECARTKRNKGLFFKYRETHR